jgi:CRISPR-associated endoribonuclease Cas6
MRIKINFTKNTENVPNNQDFINSYIHAKCLKHNDYHDTPSDYCISRLLGGTVIENGKYVNYPNGGYLLLTSLDYEFLNKIILGVMNNPNIGYGMTLVNIEDIKEEFYNGFNYFKTTKSGFILRRKNPINNSKYHTINDDDINDVLKNHIINKFSKINPNLDFSNFTVEITNHKSNKTVNLLVKNVVNTSNICQIKINSNKKLAEYIYNYGIGQSTGSGFGTIYTTQYHRKYK